MNGSEGGCRRFGERGHPVRRTPDGVPSTIQYVGVDHGRTDVGVAEEFLDGADGIPVFKQVGGEGMGRFVEVVAAALAGFRITVEPAGVGVLPAQRGGELDPAGTAFQVALVLEGTASRWRVRKRSVRPGWAGI